MVQRNNILLMGKLVEQRLEKQRIIQVQFEIRIQILVKPKRSQEVQIIKKETSDVKVIVIILKKTKIGQQVVAIISFWRHSKMMFVFKI